MRILDSRTGKPSFDSSKDHLLLDLNADPAHFDTVTVTGSPLSVNSTTLTESVFKIKHKLPYTPVVWAFMYQTGQVSGSGLLTFGTFYKNFYSYVTLGGSVIDQLNIKVNDTFFEIIHTTEAPSPYVSIADANPVAIKYYIFSRPAFNNPTY